MLGIPTVLDRFIQQLLSQAMTPIWEPMFSQQKAEADSLRARPVEEERRGRFSHVLAQIVPRIPLREDVLGKAFGAIPTVGVLDNLEYQLGHTSMIRGPDADGAFRPSMPLMELDFLHSVVRT